MKRVEGMKWSALHYASDGAGMVDKRRTAKTKCQSESRGSGQSLTASCF